MEHDDPHLIRRAQRADAQALHQLVDRYAQDLYGTARFLVGGSDSDAQDVVQETLLAMVRSIVRFRGDSSFKTWLWGILIRQAAKHRSRRRPVASFDPDMAVGYRSSEGAVDARMDLEVALARLPDDQRQVLVLREFEGMSYAEMAQVLGVPQGTIESRLHRARQALRNELAEYGS